jgi:hypothetical protein
LRSCAFHSTLPSPCLHNTPPFHPDPLLQVKRFRRVADRLASVLELGLRSAFAAWRGAAGEARLRRLRAERAGDAAAARRAVHRWAAAAAGGCERVRDREAAAEALWFASAGARALAAWHAARELAAARRAALARVVALVHAAGEAELLASALAAWAGRAARRRGVREGLISFVDARRRAALGEYLEYWRQYAAAMRADAGALSGALPALLAPRSAHQDRRLVRRMALLRGGVEVDRGSDDGAASLLEGLPCTGHAEAAGEWAVRAAPFWQVRSRQEGRCCREWQQRLRAQRVRPPWPVPDSSHCRPPTRRPSYRPATPTGASPASSGRSTTTRAAGPAVAMAPRPAPRSTWLWWRRACGTRARGRRGSCPACAAPGAARGRRASRSSGSTASAIPTQCPLIEGRAVAAPPAGAAWGLA